MIPSFNKHWPAYEIFFIALLLEFGENISFTEFKASYYNQPRLQHWGSETTWTLYRRWLVNGHSKPHIGYNDFGPRHRH